MYLITSCEVEVDHRMEIDIGGLQLPGSLFPAPSLPPLHLPSPQSQVGRKVVLFEIFGSRHRAYMFLGGLCRVVWFWKGMQREARPFDEHMTDPVLGKIDC